MSSLPSIDAHAHVATHIDERDLRELRAVVFAVTRDPKEWAAAAKREDRSCVWGLGCHPGVKGAAEGFDAAALYEHLERCAVIGEVGLDRRSKVPSDLQLRTFRAVLDVASVRPRLASIHSSGRSSDIVSELEARPIKGAILHWWRGGDEETRAAIDLGCYFSVNGAEAKNPKVLALLPPERVLTETDYPHTQRSDRSAVRPGAVTTIENALASQWGVDVEGVRQRVWRNLNDVCKATGTSGLMPRAIQVTLLSLR
jgi:TatD DNase family protein